MMSVQEYHAKDLERKERVFLVSMVISNFNDQPK